MKKRMVAASIILITLALLSSIIVSGGLPMPHADKKKLRIGLTGLSLEAIKQGKLGLAVFPTGSIDSTTGQREWETFEVEAFERVREKRDVIVTDNQGRIKEHTPVELSYETVDGGYERVGENTPLPVTTKSPKDLVYGTIAGPMTVLLFTPAVGKYVVLHNALISIGGAATVTLDIKDIQGTWQTVYSFVFAAAGIFLMEFPPLKLKEVGVQAGAISEAAITTVKYQVRVGDGVTPTVRFYVDAATAYITVLKDEES